MTDTSLEVQCNRCGRFFWYSGDVKFPASTDCPECFSSVKLPEDG